MPWQKQGGSPRRPTDWAMRHVVAVLVLALHGPATAVAAHLTPVTFVPQWLPQAQFAGYYVAAHKGFYRDRRLDVTIRTGGPDRPAVDALTTGAADCASLWMTTALRLIDRGIAVVQVAQLAQRTGLVVVARQSSGIRTPADLNGKRMAVWDGELRIGPEAFVRRHQLTVRMIPVGSSLSLFLRNGVDATTAMLYNEYHTLLSAGLNPEELTVVDPADHGIALPEDGIYCAATLRERSPDVVAAFVAASLDGWQYAFTHPEEALDIVLAVMRDAHVPANRVHQRWMLARMQDLVDPPAATLRPAGTLTRATYDAAVRLLEEQGWIRDAPAFDAFYRPSPE